MTDHRFQRTALLYGPEAMAALMRARVTIAGVGAVGSFALEALARSGVGHLAIHDFDKLQETNINRQLLALESTRGRFKSDVAAERVRDINPNCEVRAFRTFINAETAADVLAPRPDILIDAIDSLNSKVNLLAAAVEVGIPVISSMGAAMRTDPHAVRTGDLFESRHCPLARFIRKRLRRRGITSGIHCVYSVEPRRKTHRATMETVHADEVPDEAAFGRTRETLGSSACLPGIFGLVIANEAIHRLNSTVL